MNFTKENSLLLSASRFDNLGGWTLDQQFMEQMGSSYLLAHGLGIGVEDATTEAHFPCMGNYYIFVRTINWSAQFAPEASPAGQFTITLDGTPITLPLGNKAPKWEWQKAGMVEISEGRHTVGLHDLTGFDARCDAILFTTLDEAPAEGVEAIDELRRNMFAIGAPEDKGHYDFVVVGGGVAGMCAAIAAARLGVKRVALIQDRFVLGGNNSSEIRVGLGGRINVGLYPSLGYLLNEIGPKTKGNARTADVYEDDKKMEVLCAEENITLYKGYKVSGVEKQGDRLTCVIATNVRTYEQIRISGDLFSDCTGDATLGVLAGAEWHMGRESKDTFGEVSAPDVEDGMTMGASLQWYCLEGDNENDFPAIDWGLKIDEQTVQVVRRGQWYWEVGMRDDQIADAERIRDYGMYVAYSNWAYLKNGYAKREDYAKSYLGWVSCVAGKRESRRLRGEFVLREQDLKNYVIYPDGSASTSWYIDQHYPDPENSRFFPNREFLSCGHLDPMGFYPIPYRCFYSKDVKNMFMAGRNISVSHVALGTVRVMRTTAMMGEVVGMAASICNNHKALPRDVYYTHLDELIALMKKGVGRTDIQYNQIYTLIDTTAERSEEC